MDYKKCKIICLPITETKMSITGTFTLLSKFESVKIYWLLVKFDWFK